MSPSRAALATTILLVTGCRPEDHLTPHKPVDPPVASPESIPDAPLNGTIRGVPFALGDARYVADHRPGFLHTDIKLSAGKSASSCEEINPAGSTSIWLRLEGADKVGTQELRLGPDKESAWSVHYQVHGDRGWTGTDQGSAVVTLHEPGPNGKLSGGIAVCFADDQKSCVSGSFEADPCPYRIDAPVRGAPPPEAIPDKYKARLQAVPSSGLPSASATAAPGAPAPGASASSAPASSAPASSASAAAHPPGKPRAP